jgi:hypothetical protein
MLRKGEILLPVLIVLIIISLGLAGSVFYLYQKENAQNIKLQAQIVELENRQRQTASQLEESKKIATELQLKLQEAKNRIDSLSNELTTEKTAHSETTNRLEQFKEDLAKQKALREDLESRLTQVQIDSKQIKEQIKIMQQQKLALEEKIKNLEEGAANVELGKVVVNNEAAVSTVDSAAATQLNPPDNRAPKLVKKDQPPLAKGLEGKVMIVNKEFNFVVINLGSKDKISVGDEFVVSRAGKSIGDLKVEKVHEFMSAAGFAAELKDLIKENDKVMQKSK